MKLMIDNKFSVVFLALSLMVLRSETAQSAEDLPADQLKFFESKIRPVLVRECYGCHSSQVGQVRGGLWLDTAEATRSGGDSGPAIVPGNLDESLLWNAINHVDFEMPPRRKLPADVLGDFQTWIEMGAPDPRTQKESKIKSSITDEDIDSGRQFWSFQPPRRPEVPNATGEWSKTVIDRFINEKLVSHGMSPSTDAEPAVVLRRLTFDLIGLPPSLEQLSEFETAWKRDPDAAMSTMTDRLLEQPQYGERWARHWLDVARYAESAGRELNITFPNAWRYRDYVIDSFNEDKPYDRFVQQQIAGDLMPIKSDEDWAENLVATGFLAIGPKALIERNPRQFELDLVDEQIDVTTRVMLGVSVACARCHDHKFDPIPQSDYYALSGIFRSMTTHYGTFQTLQNRRASNLLELPVSDDSPVQPSLTQEQLRMLQEDLVLKQQDLREAMIARRQRQNQSPNSTPSNSNSQAQAGILQAAQLSAAVGSLQATIDSYDDQGNPLALCMGVQETRPVSARLLDRGEFNRPGQEVPRGFPQVLCQQPVLIDSMSTGRLEFARWVGSPYNPLTARVMVNRIWLHLLGNGLVRTPEDFGSTGSFPTHPELLDYLAIEFMENDWSVKQLIRQIVNSRVYRISSQYSATDFEKDPENKFYWRRDPKRLEAEAIRDSILAISGKIELEPPTASMIAKVGPAVVRDGRLVSSSQVFPGISSRTPDRPRLTERQQRALSANPRLAAGMELAASRAAAQSLDQPAACRSIYLPIVRDNIPRSLDVFDFAESSMVIGQRETSNTPDQGLYFLNNQFVLQQSDAMAKRLIETSEEPREQVRQAFLLAFGRTPNQNELRVSLDFYRAFQPESNSSIGVRRSRTGISSTSSEHHSMARLSAVCQSLMAAAEFRYLD